MSELKVLLIESDDNDTESLRNFFSGIGFSVVHSSDGRQGVEMVRTHKPSLVVLAVELPGLSGYIACKNIKRDPELAEIPLFITSSTATEETFAQHQNLKTRADEYLHKPLDFDLLTETVGKYFTLEYGPEGEVDGEGGELYFDDGSDPEVLEDVAFDDAVGDLELDGLAHDVASAIGDLDVMIEDAMVQDEDEGEVLEFDDNDVVEEDVEVAEELDAPPVAAPQPVAPAQERPAFPGIRGSQPSPFGSPKFAPPLAARSPSEPVSAGPAAELLAKLADFQALVEVQDRELEALRTQVEVDTERLSRAQVDIDTLKDIELTQQETIDRLQFEKEELQAKADLLTRQAVSPSDLEDLNAEIMALRSHAEYAESQLRTHQSETRQLLTALQTLLAEKLAEIDAQAGES
ncbi:MAG: hypothetical protein COW42_16150 [Deltaproteobacteria bacterium CG17_big_fil_post_rev_8_21_14_2_50_63_7]|nr:MAG: hypothetical protein COW42_16150 [Deltaproteobacteria bacterium CG17_big_fil_post_rev_8_21_14_2_50_63_7]